MYLIKTGCTVDHTFRFFFTIIGKGNIDYKNYKNSSLDNCNSLGMMTTSEMLSYHKPCPHRPLHVQYWLWQLQ